MHPEELNKRCIEQLAKAGIDQGGYILVVGAGPSSPLIPAVGQLKTEVAEACGLDPEDPRAMWDFFEDARSKNEDAFCRIMKSRFCDPPYWRSEAYDHLVAIRFKGYITLNYDDCLQIAFSRSEPNWEELFSTYPSRPNTGLATAADFEHKKRLVAIHGFRDESDPKWPVTKIVLTTSDYTRHYFSHETNYFLQGWWKDVLCRHDCLFVGTSLAEPGLSAVVGWLQNDGNPEFSKRRHLHLKDVRETRTMQPSGHDVVGYPKPEKVFGAIDQIHYDPMERFTGLLDVLRPFSKLSRSRSFTPKMPVSLPLSPYSDSFLP